MFLSARNQETTTTTTKKQKQKKQQQQQQTTPEETHKTKTKLKQNIKKRPTYFSE